MRYIILFAIAILAPFLFPSIITELSFLWLMILFALTWDILGGQMGYNSFGNIIFFGIGCYTVAVFQRESNLEFFVSLFLGMALSAILAVTFALILGPFILSMRGHYFSICTLGIAVAMADFFSAWEYVGAGSGIVPKLYPGKLANGKIFYYYLLFFLTASTFLTLKALYQTRFSLALNAIRDNEDKAESLGIKTARHKVLAWVIAAFFLSLAGGPVGNLVGFIDPSDLAFAGSTFGVYMILMAILGGSGTLWGPVIGAVLFHTAQELFWTYLFGWQRVALGFLIVLIVVFFPRGILGTLEEMRK